MPTENMPTEIVRISRTIAVYECRLGGKSIGVINAVKEPHAIDGALVHYAPTVEDCAAWLVARETARRASE